MQQKKVAPQLKFSKLKVAWPALPHVAHFEEPNWLRPFKTLQLPSRPFRRCQLQLSLDIPLQDNTSLKMADEVYDGAIGIDLGMFNLYLSQCHVVVAVFAT